MLFEREIEREFPSAQMPPMAVGWAGAEAESQELNTDLLHRWKEQNYLSHHHYLPGLH